MVVNIPCEEIVDSPTFHGVLARELKFFDGYGHNLDALIDCLSDLHGENALSSLPLSADETLIILLSGSEGLAERHPEILGDLFGCVAAANVRYREWGSTARVQLRPE